MSVNDRPVRGAVLLAEDDADVRQALLPVLAEEGYDVTVARDGTEAMAALASQEFDVVLSDLRMPGADGLQILQRAREVAPQTVVVLMTAHASVDTAVEALHRGAQDYLLKPLILEDVLHKLEALVRHRQLAWENQFLRTQIERRWDYENLIGRSAAMREIVDLARRVAPTPSTVLLTGESGAGKEVVARAIHHFSSLRENIFLPVNCGAIPETLLESQLFGHMKGAFTGAVGNQEGLFQRARGGTLFLDEIGDLPLNLQVKLLRAIETKEILPLGASKPAKIDFRLIAATNSDLRTAIDAGRFREDLFYRLNVFGIAVPPLRERPEDIPALVDHFIRVHNPELKKSFKGADNATVKLLTSLPWRGNVRELQNVIEHAMILGDGDWITVADLPRELRGIEPSPALPDDLREALHVAERTHIRSVLERADRDKKVAAERLGISLSSLYRKLEELSVDREGTDERRPNTEKGS